MKFSRFTLRQLFLLVVIAALGCGWWASEVRWRSYARFQQEELVRHAENVEWLRTYLKEQNFDLTFNEDGTMSIGTSSRDAYTSSLFREVQTLKAPIK